MKLEHEIISSWHNDLEHIIRSDVLSLQHSHIKIVNTFWRQCEVTEELLYY